MILRIKGLLRVEGYDGPMMLNAMQSYIHPPAHLDRWPNEDRRSRLVFITDGIEEAAIRRSLLGILDIGAPEARPRSA